MARSENRPLDGVSVVVCRAANDAESLLARLRRLGAIPIAVPLHVLADPADGGVALRAALAEIGSYQWLAATSTNGARAVVDAMGDRPWPHDLRVAAVGPVTANAFIEAGVDVDLVASPSTAAELGRAFPDSDTAGGDTAGGDTAGRARVLAPLSEAADDVLVEALRAKGYLVDRVNAYRMDEPAADEGQREAVLAAEAVLFTAPSIVDRFIDRFLLDGVPPAVISIGPRTTAQISKRGLDRQVASGGHVLIEADQHDEEGLIEALVATLGSASLDGVPSSSPRWVEADETASCEAAE